MRKLLFTLCLAAIPCLCFADLVTIDPDSFENGDVITGSFGISISSVGDIDDLDGAVYSFEDGYASTGNKVFGNSSVFQRNWFAQTADGGFAFRADFSGGTDYVSLDIIGDDISDIGVLMAYDSHGTLLEPAKTSGQLNPGEMLTAEIERQTRDIAYIIAGGSPDEEDTVHLDNLVADMPIPEPVSIILLTAGFIFVRRKK